MDSIAETYKMIETYRRMMKEYDYPDVNLDRIEESYISSIKRIYGEYRNTMMSYLSRTYIADDGSFTSFGKDVSDDINDIIIRFKQSSTDLDIFRIVKKEIEEKRAN